MKPASFLLLFLLLSPSTHAQKLWTEADRQYTIENLRRTRDDLTRAVENLTDAQWNFREAPGRWTIAEVVEHLGLWEIAWAREIGEELYSPPSRTWPKPSGLRRPIMTILLQLYHGRLPSLPAICTRYISTNGVTWIGTCARSGKLRRTPTIRSRCFPLASLIGSHRTNTRRTTSVRKLHGEEWQAIISSNHCHPVW